MGQTGRRSRGGAPFHKGSQPGPVSDLAHLNLPDFSEASKQRTTEPTGKLDTVSLGVGLRLQSECLSVGF